VVVAGASAGGVEALIALVRSLPVDFPYAVLVVLHVSPAGTSVLPAILGRACRLPVASPADGDELRTGHVYVAPPDAHLVVEDGRLRLSQAPRENGHRPAIDPTMRTAAAAYDGGTIGIVLSGSRDDGTAGLIAIKAGGGTAIAQDPREALYPAMPQSAVAHVELDAVLPVDEMANWILTNRPKPNGGGEAKAAMSSEQTGNDPHLAPPRSAAARRGPRSARARATHAPTAAASCSTATRATTPASNAA
jgi:two-component system, chemotaxis family, protein-glutamate methylesterase/glutaminase